MTMLWQRLRRWWHEPRIRLPAPGLCAGDLRPGDRLQIGCRLWRVAAWRGADPAMIFELTAAEGPADRARLRAGAGRWSLAVEGGDSSRAIELDPAWVIHFSCGAV